MAEIEITLPTVQYGNVKVRATPEELGLSSIGDSHALGVATAVYLNLFTQGFKVGASMDVVPGLQEASQMASEEQARRLLGEGLGGVTELSEYNHDGPGDVEVAAREAYDAAYSAPNDGPEPAPYSEPEGDALFDEAAKAPWENKPAPVKKPWEQGNEQPKPSVTLDAGW